MKLFDKLFGKKPVEKNEGIPTVDIPRAEVARADVNPWIDICKKDRPWYMMQYRDTETMEVHEVDVTDFEAYDKVMSNPMNQLIFG